MECELLRADQLKMPTMREEIAGLLEYAANQIRNSEDQCAAWRVADAGVMLRRLIEKGGERYIEGVDIPTGRGSLLGISITT